MKKCSSHRAIFAFLAAIVIAILFINYADLFMKLHYVPVHERNSLQNLAFTSLIQQQPIEIEPETLATTQIQSPNLRNYAANETESPVLQPLLHVKEILPNETESLLLTDDSDCYSQNSILNYVRENGTCSKTLSASIMAMLDSKNSNFNQNVPVNNYNRTILIVSLNSPHFGAIPKNYRMYRNIFFRIIFCITEMATLRQYQNGIFAPLENVTIVEYSPVTSSPPGALFHKCVPLVWDTFPELQKMLNESQLDGVLHISDDLVFNMWRFPPQRFSMDSLWYQFPCGPLFDIGNLTTCSNNGPNGTIECSTKNGWGPLANNKEGNIAAYDELKEKFPHYHKNLVEANQGDRLLFQVVADLFYIPSRYLSQAIEVLRIFVKHNVYMEMSVGNIFRAISNGSSLVAFPQDGWMGGGVDNIVHEAYDPMKLVFHPLKISQVKTASKQCLYCHLVKMFDRYRQRSNVSSG